MVLKVESLQVRLSGVSIVRDVTFHLEAGELLVVLGPNGAGKSSLLKALAGDIRTSSTGIEFAGRDLADWRRAELARRRAVMPQRVDVNFPLTVEEVVRLGRPPESMDISRPIIEPLMTLLDIVHLRSRLVSRLSGGEQQRVQLARVLSQVWDTPGPVLLLLDECTSALDPAHQQQVFGLLKQLARRRRFAVLAVAHDLNLASRYADRLMLLDQGECDSLGAPSRVLTAATLRRVYGLKARILEMDEGYPLVVPSDEPELSLYTEPTKSNCRQAS